LTSNQTSATSEKATSQPRTFACAKCGSPIIVYPPDDIHKVASRERSSFLEAVECVGACSKCNETTRLYWGKPVHYRLIVILARRTFAFLKNFLGQIPLSRIRRVRPGEANPGAATISDEDREEIENRLIDYISDNGGAIVPSKAAEELGIPAGLIKESIERMTTDGRLKPTSGSALASQNPPPSV